MSLSRVMTIMLVVRDVNEQIDNTQHGTGCEHDQPGHLYFRLNGTIFREEQWRATNTFLTQSAKRIAFQHVAAGLHNSIVTE